MKAARACDLVVGTLSCPLYFVLNNAHRIFADKAFACALKRVLHDIMYCSIGIDTIPGAHKRREVTPLYLYMVYGLVYTGIYVFVCVLWLRSEEG